MATTPHPHCRVVGGCGTVGGGAGKQGFSCLVYKFSPKSLWNVRENLSGFFSRSQLCAQVSRTRVWQ